MEVKGERKGRKEPWKAYLGVLNDQMSRRKDEGNQRGGEEHLDDGNVAIVTLEDLGEGICMVDAKAF